MPTRPPLLSSQPRPRRVPRAVPVVRWRSGLWMVVRVALLPVALSVALAQGAAAGVVVAPEAVARAAFEAMLRAAPRSDDEPVTGATPAGVHDLGPGLAAVLPDAEAGSGLDPMRAHEAEQQQTRQLYSDVLLALSSQERRRLRRAQERWQQVAQAQCQALMQPQHDAAVFAADAARLPFLPDGPAVWHDCMARQHRVRRAALHHWLMHGQSPDD